MVIEKMNNKGFTLIELLAAIVILSLVMGISASGVMVAINQSKARGEKLFVSKLSKSIDDYINLKGSSMVQNGGAAYTFDKKNNIGNSTYRVSAYQLKKNSGNSFKILDLVSEKLVDQVKLVNPKNKKQCFDNSHNPVIEVYRDSDYVYYYYVQFNSRNNRCELNSCISTLPSDLANKLDKKCEE
mgnify:CR=1 FL=1